MTDQEWLQGLKAGDEVYVGDQSYPMIETVSRVTRTQIFVRVNDRYERAFWKKDGRRVGQDHWHFTYISEPDAEVREELAIRDLRGRIKSLLEKIRNTIPATRPELEALLKALEPFVAKGDETRQD